MNMCNHIISIVHIYVKGLVPFHYEIASPASKSITAVIKKVLVYFIREYFHAIQLSVPHPFSCLQYI